MFFNFLAKSPTPNAEKGVGLDTLSIVLIYVVIIAVMYLVMIRPNKKKQQKEEQMRNSTETGDEILTIGGIYGKVVAIKEDSFIIETGPDRNKMRISKWSIQQNFNAKQAEPKEKIKAKKKKEKAEDK